MIGFAIKVLLGSVILCISLKSSIEHYIPPPNPCHIAKVCNHTWIPECGKEKTNLDLNLFFDECDRHEYNCDNKKEYEKVELASECDFITASAETIMLNSTTPLTAVQTTINTGSTTTSTEPKLMTTESITTTELNIETARVEITMTTEPRTTIIEPITMTTESLNYNCSRHAQNEYKMTNLAVPKKDITKLTTSVEPTRELTMTNIELTTATVTSTTITESTTTATEPTTTTTLLMTTTESTTIKRTTPGIATTTAPKELSITVLTTDKQHIVAFFIPQPTWEHFIWPVDICLLADLCNHTWITECGVENGTKVERRFFIDECDMIEFNCDKNRNFVLTNYSSCLPDMCGTWTPSRFLRMGNYKVYPGRKMVYAPTVSHWYHSHTHHTTPLHIPTTTRPLLPARMFHGKRRYTPHARRRRPPLRHLKTIRPLKSKQTFKRNKLNKQNKTSTPKIQNKTKRPTVVIKTLTVMKDGKMMMKIVKGFPTKMKSPGEDSDFLQ